MRKLTKAEVKEFMESIYPSYEISIYKSENEWHITVKRDYDPPEFKFKDMFKMCLFFETLAIDNESYSSGGGCETCGYGSYGELIFTVKEDEADFSLDTLRDLLNASS